MRDRSFQARAAKAAVIAVLSLAAAPAAGQGTTAAADTGTLPRTAWGEPEVQGVWDFRTLTPLERPRQFAGKEFLTNEEAAEFEQRTKQILHNDRRSRGTVIDVERAYNDFWLDYGTKINEDKRTSLIVDPADGRIPALTPEAQKQARAPRQRPVRVRVVFASGADGPEDRGLSERCMLGFNSGPPMVPMPCNNNVQLFQTPEFVVILNEMVHDARIVPLDGRPHLPQNIRQWTGDSRGHWEGETLVVETTNFTDKASFSGSLAARGAGGETFHLVERFTRIDADTLLYEFTVEDPTWWTQPWTAAVPMKKAEAPMFEYACHEGNYGMVGMLSAARAVEKAAAEVAKKEAP